MRDELDQFRAIQPCEACHGKRLKSEALAVKIKGKDISDISALFIGDAVGWFSDLETTQLSAQDQEIASRILKEINARLRFLANVGLRYLNLSRNSGTLLGRRVPAYPAGFADWLWFDRVLYVLDEPSIGLHQRDKYRLLATLTRLRDLGNTVLVVE